MRISMGERYDAVLTLRDGVFPLTAVPLGKTGKRGQLTRLRLINRTMLLHPVHLHGHNFEHVN